MLGPAKTTLLDLPQVWKETKRTVASGVVTGLGEECVTFVASFRGQLIENFGDK